MRSHLHSVPTRKCHGRRSCIPPCHQKYGTSIIVLISRVCNGGISILIFTEERLGWDLGSWNKFSAWYLLDIFLSCSFFLICQSLFLLSISKIRILTITFLFPSCSIAFASCWVYVVLCFFYLCCFNSASPLLWGCCPSVAASKQKCRASLLLCYWRWTFLCRGMDL